MYSNTTLSKGVLELKFMKRTKEKLAKLEDDEEREELYSDQLSTLQSGAESVSVVPSHFDCHEYLPTRLSFGGFEPDTEKLNVEKLKGLYTALRTLVPTVDPNGGMEVDATAEDFNNCVNGPEEEGQGRGKKNFVHKNTKANRFNPRPPKKSNPNFQKDNRGKFDKKNKFQGRKDSFKTQNGSNAGANDNQSFKRKSDHFDEDNKQDSPKRKFLKPQE